MSLLKIEFSTVRELEKKTFRIFGYGGAAFVFSILLWLFGLAVVGGPLMVLSIVFVIAAMVWVSMLGKEAHRPVFCPYCASPNDVYVSKRRFNCDICHRPITFNDAGEAVAVEAIDTQARYDRPPSL